MMEQPLLTDADGRFSVPWASKSGAERTRISRSPDFVAHERLTIEAIEQLDPHTFSTGDLVADALVPALTGRVIDRETGAGLSWIQVWASTLKSLSTSNDRTLVRCLSGESGVHSLMVPQGSTELSLDLVMNGEYGLAGRVPAHVAIGSTLDLYCTRWASVGGTIEGLGGIPGSYLKFSDFTGQFSRNCGVDPESGRFRINQMRPGPYAQLSLHLPASPTPVAIPHSNFHLAPGQHKDLGSLQLPDTVRKVKLVVTSAMGCDLQTYAVRLHPRGGTAFERMQLFGQISSASAPGSGQYYLQHVKGA